MTFQTFDPTSPEAESQAWAAALNLNSPPDDFDTPAQDGRTAREMATEVYNTYYDARKAKGLLLFPTQKTIAARETTEGLRKMYSGLASLKDQLDPESWQQVELGAKGENDPDEYKARVVNSNALKTMFGQEIPPERLGEVVQAYAKQEFGMEGPVTHKDLYGAIEGRYAEDEAAAKAFSAHLTDMTSKRLATMGKRDVKAPTLTNDQIKGFDRPEPKSLEYRPTLAERDAFLETVPERLRDSFRNQWMEQTREISRLQSKAKPIVDKIVDMVDWTRDQENPESMLLLTVNDLVNNLPENEKERSMVLAMASNALGNLGESERGALDRVINSVRRGPYQASGSIVQSVLEQGRQLEKLGSGRQAVRSLSGDGSIVKDSGPDEGLLSNKENDFQHRRNQLLSAIYSNGMDLHKTTDSFLMNSAINAAPSAWMFPAMASGFGNVAVYESMQGQSSANMKQLYPNMDEGLRVNTAFVSGAVQGFVETFSNKLVAKSFMGKFPGMAALLNKANIQSAGGRFAAGAAGGMASTFATEYPEEAIQGTADALLSGFAADMSNLKRETDWKEYLAGWGFRGKDVEGKWQWQVGEEQAQTMSAILGFGMIAGGGAGFQHFKYGAALQQNRSLLRGMGATEPEIREIVYEQDPEKASAKAASAFENAQARAAASPEEAARQEALRAEALEILKASNDAYSRAGMPRVQKEINSFTESDEWIFMDTVTGERKAFETEEQALVAWQDWSSQQSEESRDLIEEASRPAFLDHLLQEGSMTEDVNVNDTKKTVTPETELAGAQAAVKSAETDQRKAITPAQERQARIALESAQGGLRNIKARIEMFLLDRGIDSTNASAVSSAMKGVAIKAKSFATYLGDKIVGYTVELYNGHDVMDIGEDFAETAMKMAVESGFTDPEILLDDIRRYERASGNQVIKQGYEYDPANRLPLIEGFSSLARGVMVGNVRTGLLPPEVAAWVEMMANMTAVSVNIAKSNAAGAQFAQDVMLAGQWRDAVAKKQVPPRLERLLMDSLGMDPEAINRRLERKMEEQLAAEAMEGFPELGEEMKGKLPHPETLRENNHPLYGEVRRIWESLKKPTKRRTKQGRTVDRTTEANAYFLPVGTMEDLDSVRESMNERGFAFDSITDMLDALDVSISYGKPFYGTASTGDESWAVSPMGVGVKKITKAPEEVKVESDPFNGEKPQNPHEWRKVWKRWEKTHRGEWRKTIPLPEGPVIISGITSNEVGEIRRQEERSHFEAAAVLPQLLENSVLAFVESPTSDKKNVQEVHKRYAWMVTSEGNKRHVLINLMRWKGNVETDTAYSVESIEVQKESAVGNLGLQTPPTADLAASDGDAGNLARFIEGIKPEHRRVNKNDESYAMSHSGVMRLEDAIAKRMTRGPDERANYFQKLRDRLASTILMLRESKRNIALDQTDTERERNRIRDAMAEASAIIKALPMEARGRVPFNMNDILDADTERGQINGLIRLIDKADDALEFVLRKEYAESFETLLDLAKPDLRQNKQIRGRLTPKTQLMVGKILQAVTLTPAELDVATLAKQAELDALEATNPETKEEIAAAQARLIELYEEQVILETFGAFSTLGAEQMGKAYEQLQSIYITGRTTRRILDEAKKAEVAEAKKELLSTLPYVDQGKHAERMADKGFIDQVEGLRLGLSSFHQVMEWIFPRSTTARDLQEKVRKASRQFTQAKIDAKERFDRFTFGVWNLSGMSRNRKRNRILADLSTLRNDWGIEIMEGVGFVKEKLTEEQAAAILDGSMKVGWETDMIAMTSLRQAVVDFRMQRLKAQNEDKRFSSTVIKFQRLTSRGTPGPFVASDMQALYFLQLWAQEQYRPALDKHGFTESVISTIERKINKKAHDLGDFLRDEYDAEWDRLNPVYRAIYGLDMPKIRNYAPGMFEHLDAKGGADSTIDPYGAAPGVNAMSAGFTKARTHHMARPKLTNAMAGYWSHLEATEYFIAYAEVLRDARQIFRNPEVRRRIEGNFGLKVAGLFSQWLDALEVDGNFRAAELAALSEMTHKGLATQSAVGLAFNIGVLFKQTSAMMGVLLEMPTKQAISGMARAIANPSSLRNVWTSQAVQQRILAGISPEDRKLIDAGKANPSIIIELLEVGRLPIAYADAAFTTLGASVAYNYHLGEAVKANLPPVQAEAFALAAASRVIERTAQPAETQDKSMAENTARGFMKALFLFKSDPRKQLAIVANAVAEVGRGTPGAKGKLARKTFWGWAMYGLSAELLSDVWAQMSRDDDDPDRWAWNDYVASMICGPISGIPLVGSSLEYGVRALVGTKAFLSTNNPVEQGAERLIPATKKAIAMLTGEKEGSISDILTASQQAAAAVALVAGAVDPRAAILPAGVRVARDAWGMMHNAASLFMEPTADDKRLEVIKEISEKEKISKDGKAEEREKLAKALSKLPVDARTKELARMDKDTRNAMLRKLRAASMTSSEMALSRLSKDGRKSALEKITADMGESDKREYLERLKTLGLD